MSMKNLSNNEEISIEFGEEEDEETVPAQYTTKSYPKDPEDPTQTTHKSIQKSLLLYYISQLKI